MKAVKADGSKGVTIASNQAGPQGLAIDATSVYWANKGGRDDSSRRPWPAAPTW